MPSHSSLPQYIQVTNLANTSSLVYHSLLSYPTFGDGPSSVNWCGELSPLFVFVTHAPRAAPGFSWTAGCQLEKKIDPNPLRNNLLFSQDSTSSPPYFRLQRFVWTTALLPTSPTGCSWGRFAASLLVSPLTLPPDGARVFAQMPSCLVGPSSYPTLRRIRDTLPATATRRVRSSVP